MLLLHALAVACFPTSTSAVANFRLLCGDLSHTVSEGKQEKRKRQIITQIKLLHRPDLAFLLF